MDPLSRQTTAFSNASRPPARVILTPPWPHGSALLRRAVQLLPSWLLPAASLGFAARPPAIPRGARFEQLQSRFDEARAQRLRGDFGTCLATLLATLEALDQELATRGGSRFSPPLRQEERQQLERWIEQARYSGQPPARERLDTIERRVERGLDELRPDPNRAERSRLCHLLRTESPRPGHSEGFLPLTPRQASTSRKTPILKKTSEDL